MKKLSTIALIASIVLMSACGPKDPGLKDAYKNYFLMGVAVTPRNVTDSLQSSIILKEFNSITAENCMKPGELHPAPGVWNLEQADIIANFCREHGIKMRGHCLVWHSQFANWMFNKYDENGNQVVERDEKGDTIWVEQQVRGGFGGFGGQRPQGQQAQQGQRPQGQPGQAPQGFQGFGGQRPQGQQAQAQAPQTVKVPKYVRATKEEFYDSLRAHINFVVNRYKDVIYCWDVVNEAMSDANNPDAPYEQTFRQTQAYQLCGDEFIRTPSFGLTKLIRRPACSTMTTVPGHLQREPTSTIWLRNFRLRVLLSPVSACRVTTTFLTTRLSKISRRLSRCTLSWLTTSRLPSSMSVSIMRQAVGFHSAAARIRSFPILSQRCSRTSTISCSRLCVSTKRTSLV